MTTIKTEVKTFRIDTLCTICKKGKMLYENVSSANISPLILTPPEIKHRCDNKECNAVEYLPKLYPYLTYEDVTSEIISSTMDD